MLYFFVPKYSIFMGFLNDILGLLWI
jgi:hypothetical protein